MIKTKNLAIALVATIAPLLTLLNVFNAVHWSDGEKTVVAGCAATTIALVVALYEHLRSDTPSRWVAVLNLLGPEVGGIVAVCTVFGVMTDLQGLAVISVLAPMAQFLGISLSQDKVYSPETTNSLLLSTQKWSQSVGMRAGQVAPPATPADAGADD